MFYTIFRKANWGGVVGQRTMATPNNPFPEAIKKVKMDNKICIAADFGPQPGEAYLVEMVEEREKSYLVNKVDGPFPTEGAPLYDEAEPIASYSFKRKVVGSGWPTHTTLIMPKGWQILDVDAILERNLQEWPDFHKGAGPYLYIDGLGNKLSLEKENGRITGKIKGIEKARRY